MWGILGLPAFYKFVALPHYGHLYYQSDYRDAQCRLGNRNLFSIWPCSNLPDSILNFTASNNKISAPFLLMAFDALNEVSSASVRHLPHYLYRFFCLCSYPLIAPIYSLTKIIFFRLSPLAPHFYPIRYIISACPPPCNSTTFFCPLFSSNEGLQTEMVTQLLCSLPDLLNLCNNFRFRFSTLFGKDIALKSEEESFFHRVVST